MSVVKELTPVDPDDNAKIVTYDWLAIIKTVSISLFYPFVNGIMLGFGEIFAHELGLNFGWRSARVFDPSSPITNARKRRRWLFGL